MATTARGHIEQLPSGSFRVHVYAGIDPVTGKQRRLKRTCPDEAAAAAALGQLLSQADGDRFTASFTSFLKIAASFPRAAPLTCPSWSQLTRLGARPAGRRGGPGD